MSIVLQGTVAGHEARGRAAIATDDEGASTLTLTDLWVAPGAPDVRLYVTARGDAVVDDAAVDLGPIEDGATAHEVRLPAGVDVAQLSSVIVYCKVFSVLFGSASLSPPT